MLSTVLIHYINALFIFVWVHAHYWSNHFSVRYEKNRKTKPNSGHFRQFRNPSQACPGKKRALMVTLMNHITCVGVIWVMSSDASCLSKVVLPPLSNPRSNIRTSWSGVLLSLRKIDNNPWKPSKTRRLNKAPSLCNAWRHKYEHQQTNRFQGAMNVQGMCN